HGTGKRDYVPAMARAALAAGADGLLIEAHPEPDRALSDGAQSLGFAAFEKLLASLRRPAEALGGRINWGALPQGGGAGGRWAGGGGGGGAARPTGARMLVVGLADARPPLHSRPPYPIKTIRYHSLRGSKSASTAPRSLTTTKP